MLSTTPATSLPHTSSRRAGPAVPPPAPAAAAAAPAPAAAPPAACGGGVGWGGEGGPAWRDRLGPAREAAAAGAADTRLPRAHLRAHRRGLLRHAPLHLPAWCRCWCGVQAVRRDRATPSPRPCAAPSAPCPLMSSLGGLLVLRRDRGAVMAAKHSPPPILLACHRRAALDFPPSPRLAAPPQHPSLRPRGCRAGGDELRQRLRSHRTRAPAFLWASRRQPGAPGPPEPCTSEGRGRRRTPRWRRRPSPSPATLSWCTR